MKKICYMLSGLLIIAFSACKKDLLDSKPLSQYSDATVWKDSTLVKLYVSNIYRGMPSEYESASSFDALSNYTDESTDNRTFVASYTYNTNTNNATNAPFNSLWNAYYVQIRNCNVFLDNIGSLNASAGLKNRFTGEVRFLRALYYHYLYNYFGRFPILTKTLNTTDNLYIPRGSNTECINFITAELQAASDMLPKSYTGNDRGRATKGAALALMCRTYLYGGQWQKAADAATAVMQLNLYSLYPDYQSMFYTANEYNSEVILDKEYLALSSTNQSTSFDNSTLPPNYTGRSSGAINPNGALVDAYEMKDGTTFDWNNPVHKADPYANRDPRFDASIVHDGTVLYGLPVNMFVGSTANPATRPSATGYYIRKGLDPTYDPNQTLNFSGQNFIMIRYAEVLLNYAEAQYNLGNIEEARTYVNKVRARTSVNMPAIPAISFTMDKLRHERFVELAFEGLRLWDINRWKIGPQTRGAASLTGVTIGGTLAGPHTYTPVAVNAQRQFADKMNLFPIPYTEIIKYPASTPLVQNTGWEQ
ncbi:RagB/SusD family nutrient uptake outer membrane protein [Pedobacter hiemivivus]|uniref:RagB/SusD family nutrient uptake outer membrane protein n=1 Tax=Pedobacter hiemivivus TaxID=2530454 RepID=A0A4U1G8F0_9SPHI|nr:RagB/SusD family nutrient uptake outer membrane protein [Pedobacter hiemivivus]TKC59139.1 RagB/SusD family nutrient uptake outer membrane protein [Pedobacter hiemivivus]